MSLATMTNDVETFDFSEEIRAFQARVKTGLTSVNFIHILDILDSDILDFDAVNKLYYLIVLMQTQME